MTPSSFTRKRITLTFRLGQGDFGTAGVDTVKIEDHRVHATIDKIGGPAMGTAQLRVYGLKKDLLRRLSALNQATQTQRQNAIAIEAGDTNGMSLVFQGQITVAQVMFNLQPDAPLMVIAQSGALEAIQKTEPTSYPGQVAVADILQNLAARMGMDFRNYGVSTQLPKAYFTGSPRDQVEAVRQAGRGEYEVQIDDGNPATNRGTVYLWPKDGYRNDLAIPLISPATGLIGYPDYSTSTAGIGVNCLFNPGLSVGGLVQVQSSYEPASGTWKCFGFRHDIQSETPGGAWMTHFDASAYTGAAHG